MCEFGVQITPLRNCGVRFLLVIQIREINLVGMVNKED